MDEESKTWNSFKRTLERAGLAEELSEEIDHIDHLVIECERLREDVHKGYAASVVLGRVAALLESESATIDQVKQLLGDINIEEAELLDGSTLAPFKVDAGHYMAGVMARCFAEVLRNTNGANGIAVELSPAHWPPEERLTVTIAKHGIEIPAEKVKRLEEELKQYKDVDDV